MPNCIESLMSQTIKDLEIILVDDGSPDRSGQIADKYAKVDPRIRVIHQPNQGVSAARNAGLAVAHGSYIGFVDPDDWVAPEMYELMIDAMEREGADMAACGYDYYDEECNIDSSRRYRERPDEVMSLEVLFSQLSDMPPSVRHVVWSKLFRKDLLDGLRFNEDLRSSEDLDFLMNYIGRVNRTVFVHKPLYKNTVREGSATHGGLNIASLRDSLAVHERMYLDTIREFPHLKGKAIAYLMDVSMLKYNEARRKADQTNPEHRRALSKMRRFLRRYALSALTSSHIFWKTRIYYLLSGLQLRCVDSLKLGARS